MRPKEFWTKLAGLGYLVSMPRPAGNFVPAGWISWLK